MAMIECENLVKIYKTSEVEVIALQGLDLVVEEGEMMAMIGKSGSGKTTILNILGGLDVPTAGRCVVNGRDLLKMKPRERVVYKRKTVGFVWQNNARNLLPYLSAEENVMLPMVLTSRKEKMKRAGKLLEMVGLYHRRKNRLDQLSGGEQQRVAIAIALANEPVLLLADEPTGSVDSKTADMIFDIFRDLNRQLNQTIVIVTHDTRLSAKVDRVVNIRDGRTSSEFIRKISYSEELAALQQQQLQKGQTHTEWLVLDRAGRLQLPQEYIEQLSIAVPGRMLSVMEGDRIVLLKDEPGKAEEQTQST